MNATTLEKPSLSARLKHDTAAEHERMHQLMEQGAPFSGRDRYTRFVAAQYLFQRDVEHLFADPRVQTV
ncbi:MAG: biliverdin-producing heme oxygenase, partial [Myxococcota bacterium]